MIQLTGELRLSVSLGLTQIDLQRDMSTDQLGR